MRILMVGANSKYAIEKPYLKYLSRQKEVSYVELFAAQDIFLAYYQKNILNKMIYRVGLSKILDRINRELKTKIDDCRPDIVLIFKGMEIFPGTLRWIQKRKIKLVNYNPDNPFIFSGKGSGNSNVTKGIRLYDLYMSYDKGVCLKLENDYHVRSALLPFGFDVPGELFEACKAEPEKVKVCFVGNTDIHRLNFLNALAREGIEIDLFGMNWNERQLHKNIKFFGPVFEDRLWKTLRSYRVQLNLMRIHNPESHNMRSFEVAGIGGIQLAQETVDHETYFIPGKEIFLFRDIGGCISQVKMLLGLSPGQAEDIRTAARARSVNTGYSYQSRVRQLLYELSKLNLNGN